MILKHINYIFFLKYTKKLHQYLCILNFSNVIPIKHKKEKTHQKRFLLFISFFQFILKKFKNLISWVFSNKDSIFDDDFL